MQSIFIHRVTLPIIIYLVSFISSYAVSYKFDIQIDAGNKSLVAPQACSYQWYSQGHILQGETKRSLQINKGGTYEVLSINDKGSIEEFKITVAVNAAGAIIKIILIGDSTVAQGSANGYPSMGWGHVLNQWFNASNITVRNFAKSGTSTTTFYRGYWPAAKAAIAAGDYVLMQFGHNDQKADIPTQYAPAYGLYQEYLTKYATEIRALGAIPVFVTSVNRNIWSGGVLSTNSLGDYPDAVRKLGVTLKVPVIDLHAKSAALYTLLGESYLTSFVMSNYLPGEYPNFPNGTSAIDKTHFSEAGSIEISRLVVESMKELAATTPSISALTPFLKPVYEVSVTTNPKSAAALTTRSASYPAGMTVTLKTVAKAPNRFINWNDAANKSVSSKLIYQFPMQAKPTAYAAIYNNAVLGVEEELAVANSSAYPNPFSNSFRINTTGSFEYTITTAQGVEIEKGKADQYTVIGSNLGKGIYFIKYTIDNVNKTAKILKSE